MSDRRSYGCSVHPHRLRDKVCSCTLVVPHLPLEDVCYCLVCDLHLFVRLRVVDRGEAKFDAIVLAKFLQLFARELNVIVDYYL